MFKRAAAKTNYSNAPASPSNGNGYFRGPNATAPVTRQQPLHMVTGNSLTRATSAPNEAHKINAPQRSSFKRTASGLTKALATSNGFDDGMYPTVSQTKSVGITGYTTTNKAGKIVLDDFEFDENDFASDFGSDDFDIEPARTTTMRTDTVTYPDLSSKLPDGPVKAENTSFGAQSDSAIPWSSSPASHFQQPMGPPPPVKSIKDFRYTGPTNNTVTTPRRVEAKPRAAKSRKLPWPTEDKAATTTPKNVGQGYHWDLSASGMKKNQRTVREASKKRIKTMEDDDSKASAIETSKKKRPYRIFLSDEQQAVLNMVVDDGKSVFFTGSAGTGKSVLLREIISRLRKKFAKETDRVAITASTGLAACNIGGVTLHSFSGIGLGNASVPELIKKIKRNPKAKNRWMRTKVLIMDEVSMVDGDLYDKLEQIARKMKNNGRPFGGIQLVITGDFFQLPPVPEKGKEARFCFNANSWNTTIDKTIALHKVFRQKDPEFANMLNQMREGRLDQKSIQKFKSLSRELHFEDDLDATELFSTRFEVDRANVLRLAHLPGESRVYEARDGGTVTEKEYRDKLLANVMAPQTITLKQGAQVMLIKNMDDTLVNGSLGKVIGFMSDSEFNNYQESEDQFLASQVPTAAKTNKVTVDMAGLGSAGRYPVVRFAIADGTTRDMLCNREQWSVELPNGEVQASRSQIPLILAWALSIHKAQGQTLERVKVNLSKAFERGQAYVALSRATSMAGLQVIGFDASKVLAHDAVRRFYAGLTRLEDSKAKAQTQKLMPGAYPPSAGDPEEQSYEGMFDEDDDSWM